MAPRSRTTEQATPRPTNISTALPAYQAPFAPLTTAQQRALSQLPHTHALKELSDHLQNAYRAINANASAVNDVYQEKVQRLHKKQERRQRHGQEPDEEENESLENLRTRVDHLTEELESSVRGVCDGHERVAAIERALKNAHNSSRDAPNDAVEGEFDEDLAAYKIFQDRIASEKAEYEAKSMRERYGNNNDYRGFKRLVHDSRHPGENAPPVPLASTWFPQDHSTGEEVDAGTDEDIAIESEKTSLKCPLTLVIFNDPVSSTKCPHSFEHEAIVSIIQASNVRVGPGNTQRGRGEKAVKCPCCEKMLTLNDLKQDPILVRQVERFKARATQEEDEDEEDDRMEGVEEINDDSTLSRGEAIGAAQAARIKAERIDRRRTRTLDFDSDEG